MARVGKYRVGMVVRALGTITDGGAPRYEGRDNAVMPDPDFIHARKGMRGVVEYVEDDGVPTIRFTGGATIVGDAEIEILNMTGAERIAAERYRQVEEEGWDAKHDDRHEFATMPIHAAALAVYGSDAYVVDPTGMERGSLHHTHKGDAWGLQAKHGKDPIRSLEIAGALIAAEIDRLLRRGL